MPTKTIVKTLHILKDGLSGLDSALKAMSVNAFALERAEEALHRSVIITLARSTHADNDVHLC